MAPAPSRFVPERAEAWCGSNVTEADLDVLRRYRQLPSADLVATRIPPSTEVVPVPQDGEYIVFLSHFERGFGLPASRFLREILDRFELQMQSLPANNIMFLSAMVTADEAYLGVPATRGHFERNFYLRSQTAGGAPYVCGAASIFRRKGTIFSDLPVVDSAKRWQGTYFYVKNVPQPAEVPGGEPRLIDNINLPAPMLNPPLDRSNWGALPKVPMFEEANVRLLDLEASNGLQKRDLIAAMFLLRVQPLQRREHLMCYLCGPRNACRGSSNEISPARVNRRYRELTQAELPSGWKQDHMGVGPGALHSQQPASGGKRSALFQAFQPFLVCHLNSSGYPFRRAAVWRVADAFGVHRAS
jgi:hypothetical protein